MFGNKKIKWVYYAILKIMACMDHWSLYRMVYEQTIYLFGSLVGQKVLYWLDNLKIIFSCGIYVWCERSRFHGWLSTQERGRVRIIEKKCEKV